MNFSKIPSNSLLGKVIRWPLRLLPPKTHMPILQGKLLGKTWIVGSSNHGCWLGSYEKEKCKVFERIVKPSQIVYDIGANVGYYTMLASELVGPQGRVVAFEPLPKNLDFIRKHLELNSIKNTTLLGVAVSHQTGAARFIEGQSRAQGRLSDDGTMEIRTVSLDDLIFSGELPRPDVLKIDIEGAELGALQGAKSLLFSSHPALFVATHSPQIHADCCKFLESFGYFISSLDGKPLDQSSELLATHESITLN